MSSPLPSNMAMTTVRGRYGAWTTAAGESAPHFTPYVGMHVTFSAAYPFVTNTTATPSPVVIATAPRTFTTDSAGYISDPANGNDRNCLIISSDDPDIYPRDWKYLVTFTGPGATHFRSFRTPAPSGATVDMAVITPQRVTSGSSPSSAEIAAANAAASAAAAQAAVASINRGQAGGVAPLDADGDVNDAFGVKILAGGGGGSVTNPHTILANIDNMSPLARLLNTDLLPADMRTRIGAGTSNLALGTTSTTAKAGDYQPTPAQVQGSTSIGQQLITATDAAAARTIIGAGTGASGLVLGTTAGTAKEGNYQPTPAQIQGSTAVGQALIVAASQAAARTAIGAGTSSLVIGTTTGTVPDAALTNTALTARALDSAVVHTNGDETIDGAKTFLDPVAVPAAVSAGQAVNLAQMQSATGAFTNYSTIAGLPGYPATFPPTLPIAQSGITGLVTDLGALDTRLDAVEAVNFASVPWLLGTTAGVYPPRPATTRAVWFMDPNVQPTNNGVVTGGGGMVPDGTLPGGLMDLWIS